MHRRKEKGDTVTVTINGKEIFYRRAGDRGEPIVFVHGNSLSSRTFQKQLESVLADSYRLFAPDLPGHGQSFRAENPKSDYNPKAYAEMLAAFAREVEAENSIFVGWSLGGHILLEASDLLPDARGFMIFGTPPVSTSGESKVQVSTNPIGSYAFKSDLTDEERQALVLAFFHPDFGKIPDLFIEDHIQTDKQIREVLAEVIKDGTVRDEVGIVKTLKIPLAVVHGASDQLIDLNYLKSLQYANLYTDDVIIIQGAGHAPHWEQPDAFNTILKKFIIESVSRE